MDRREFIKRAGLAVTFGAIGAVSIIEVASKLAESKSVDLLTSSTTGPSPQAPAGYVFVAPLSALAGKTYAYFSHPTGGTSILVDYGGQWRAFSAFCTHAGCTVDYTGTEIYCPCHAGAFSPVTGAVLAGPPPTPLPEYTVLVQSGNLYVSR